MHAPRIAVPWCCCACPGWQGKAIECGCAELPCQVHILAAAHIAFPPPHGLPQCDRWEPQVQQGKVYLISKASLRNKRGNFNQAR